MSAEQLKERINNMQEFMRKEAKEDVPSQTYIEDLVDSIASCKRQLAFHTKNPDGVLGDSQKLSPIFIA